MEEYYFAEATKYKKSFCLTSGVLGEFFLELRKGENEENQKFPACVGGELRR